MQLGNRAIEYICLTKASGREISSELMEMGAERDIPTLRNGALRMRSNQVAVQFQDYPKLIITRYEIVKPARGEMPMLHHQLFLEDLDCL